MIMNFGIFINIDNFTKFGIIIATKVRLTKSKINLRITKVNLANLSLI